MKPSERLEHVDPLEAFPGLLGRGLIEAGGRRGRRAAERRSFPGLLGRGLIEAGFETVYCDTDWSFPRSTGPGPH